MPNRFLIEELLPLSSSAQGIEPARFEWTASGQSIPVAPWVYTVSHKSHREDYPGGKSTTEQMLGGKFEPFDIRGRWDDRQNPLQSRNPEESLSSWGSRARGFAKNTRQEMEALILRGNPCRFTWKDIIFVGVIKQCRFEIFTQWRVGYTISVSPHDRDDQIPKGGSVGSPDTNLDPRSHANLVEEETRRLIDALDPQDSSRSSIDSSKLATLPSELAGSSSRNEILELAFKVSSATAAIQRQVDALLDPVADAVASSKALVSSFAVARGRAQAVLDKVGSIRAGTENIFNAVSLARFESWKRGIAYQCRKIVDLSYLAERDVVRYSEDDIIAVYVARPSESLYKVSMRFYGTPESWKLIAQRNGLDGYILEGGEVLLIPRGVPR